jgi:hypothetical protein
MLWLLDGCTARVGLTRHHLGVALALGFAEEALQRRQANSLAHINGSLRLTRGGGGEGRYVRRALAACSGGTPVEANSDHQRLPMLISQR